MADLSVLVDALHLFKREQGGGEAVSLIVNVISNAFNAQDAKIRALESRLASLETKMTPL